MNGGYILEDLILVSGVTGTEVGVILEIASKEPEIAEKLNFGRCIYKFEDLVRDIALGPCGDIGQIIKLLLISRPSARGIFKRAVEEFKEKIIENNCKSAMLSIHFSYLSRDVPSPNPILGEIVKLARNVKAVHVSEDWYDILVTISERLTKGKCRSQYSPYNFNYLTVLYWRGIDMNISELLMDQYDNVKSFIYAIKHPRETTVRFIKYLLGMKDLEPVYISHPITTIRKLYLEIKCRELPHISLRELLLVRMIEEFKRAYLNANAGIILFDPTTIDEKILDLESSIFQGICRKYKSESNCKNTFTFVYLDYSNRWPIPKDASGMAKRRYKYIGDKLNLIPILARLAGEEEAMIEGNICREAQELWGAYELVTARVKSIIDSHIEIRDYKYVEQSKYIIVALPVIYKLNPIGITKATNSMEYSIWIWLVESQGVYNELARAQALAKPIYIYLLPVNIDVISNSLNINSANTMNYLNLKEDNACIPDMKIDTPSDIEAIIRAIGSCVNKRLSAPFSLIPATARVFVARPLNGLEDVERLSDYYGNLDEYMIII